MKDIAYLLALHAVDGLGPIRLKQVLDYFPDAKQAWNATESELKKIIPEKVVVSIVEKRKSLNPEKYLQSITNQGIKVVSLFDNDYPESLKQIYDPPIILYYKGELGSYLKKSVGVVGSRKMTSYGRLVTEDFVSGLVSGGLCIVSGLARGVDTVAHQSAVKAGGKTIAVLGGGLNKLFPPENASLVERILGQGVVLSEFPPDYPALAGNFPSRNRIIAGLSLGILVTEADEDSGSLITARLGLDLGKPIFAVPGSITSQLSKGPAMLIRDGATLVLEPKDVLDELGLNSVEVEIKQIENLSEIEKLVLESTQNQGCHVDEICRELKRSVQEVSGILIKLEIQGYVRNLGGGVYISIVF